MIRVCIQTVLKCGGRCKYAIDILPIKKLNISIYLFILVDAISCYKCESYRDYRCLDPFDFRPHPQINCDYEPFAREKKPVFCEKVTDLSMLYCYSFYF